MDKAFFFDRDGVLNVDSNLITDFKDIIFVDHIADIIASLRHKGFKIFVVTNQTVISRGLITEEELNQLNITYINHLITLNKDAIIDEISYCPHHPEATLEKYRLNCDCRKPHPGMILDLAKKHAINLQESYMIGDRISDIISGYLAGCKTILIKGENDNSPLIVSNLPDYKKLSQIKPDFIINSLKELEGIV